jgi:hypothetical protein
MSNYIRYTLEGGSTLLIEAPAEASGIVQAGMKANYTVTLKWQKDPLPDEVGERIRSIRRRMLRRTRGS